MQAPGLPRGVCRISAAHDVAALARRAAARYLQRGAWPATLIGGLDGFERGERGALVAVAAVAPPRRRRLPHRRAWRDDDVFKKPDPVETWRYIDFHVTNYSLGAIETLDPRRAGRCSTSSAPGSTRCALEAWLARARPARPLAGGQQHRQPRQLPAAAGARTATRRRASGRIACLAILFDWHDRLQEPATGFWGVGQLSDPSRALHAMAGSMHNFHLWYATGRPAAVPGPGDRLCRCPSRRPSTAPASMSISSTCWSTRHALHRPPPRRDRGAGCATLLPRLLAFQNADGGFCDVREGVRRQDGWVRGYEEPQGLSNTFATWFRWIAIAMIADCLWPGALALAFPPHGRHRLPRNRPMTATARRSVRTPARRRLRRAPTSAPRSDARRLVTMAGRATEALDGDWRFTLDLFDEGLRQKWFADDAAPPDRNGPTPRDYDAGGGRAGRRAVVLDAAAAGVDALRRRRVVHAQTSTATPPPSGRARVLRIGAANYAGARVPERRLPRLAPRRLDARSSSS